MANRTFLVAAAIMAAVAVPLSAIPAFPDAEGFGAETVGGRDGRVIFVTNLNDSGPGSLRAAVESKDPRTVIFRISGTIPLESSLRIRNPHITIAGQTAPGGGICLKNYALSISADEVIVRHIRCRPGDDAEVETDAISISAGKNIIVDHCSASWCVDECLSASTSGQLGNVTVQWCIISESLNRSVHHKGSHGYGSLIRGGFGNGYTFHHNLYAHHRARLPRPGNYNDKTKDPKGLLLDFRNNLIYNWAGSAAGYNADGSNGDNSITKMNFVGNYYKTGPNTSGRLAFSESTKTACAFFADNAMNGLIPEDPWSLVTFRDFSQEELRSYQLAKPLSAPAVATDDPDTAFKRILEEAGATLPRRDAVDARIVADVINGTGQIIDDEAQVGGWPELKSTAPPADSDEDGIPDAWEKAHNLDPADPQDASASRKPDSYTNLELYLNSL